MKPIRRVAYLIVAAWLAVQAVVYLRENATVTGPLSAITLVASTLALGLCVVTLLYAKMEWSDQPAIHGIARGAWTAGVLLLAGTTMAQSFIQNDAAIGLAATVTALWFILSFGSACAALVIARPAPPRPAASPTPAAPANRIGKYEIRGQLGRGAMGTVHDGWDPVIGRRVAIKTILLSHEDTDTSGLNSAARFRQEAQAAGRLLHPNIVSVFDYGEIDGTAHIVMEFLDGPTLGAWLTQQGRPQLSDIVRIMDDILTGLAYCHEQNVVHRDIKPANIMLTRQGRAKIADFGIARMDGGSLTQTGMITGTASYMSPEQFRGEPVDARTDIYACGVLLFLMLTGQRPFIGGGVTEIMGKVLSSDVPAPSEHAAVPPAFDAVVKRAMAKRPDERFPTATAFASALRAVKFETGDDTTRAIQAGR